jgi:hypothetical protein
MGLFKKVTFSKLLGLERGTKRKKSSKIALGMTALILGSMLSNTLVANAEVGSEALDITSEYITQYPGGSNNGFTHQGLVESSTGAIYSIGGYYRGLSGSETNGIYKIDLVTKAITLDFTLPTDLAEVAVARIDDENVFVFGGYQVNYIGGKNIGAPQDDVYKVNLTTKTAVRVWNLPYNIQNAKAIVHPNGKIYIFTTGSVIEYDPIANRATSLISYTDGTNYRAPLAELASDGSIYVMGHNDNSWGSQPNVPFIYKFNPEGNVLTKVGTITGNGYPASSVYKDGKIYMFMYYNTAFQYIKDVIEFDPSTNQTKVVGQGTFISPGNAIQTRDGDTYLFTGSNYNNPAGYLHKMNMGPSLNLNVVNTNNNASVTWSTIPDAVSFDLSRGSDVIYTGNALSFNDTNLTPATNYSYSLVAKDSTGKRLNTSSRSITTPIAVPSNLTAVTDSAEKKLNITWDSNGNPANTQYIVSAVNTNPESKTDRLVVEGFEGASEVGMTGNWVKASDQKRTGIYSLKSATIGNSQTTSSQFTVTIPAGQTSDLSFFHKVSSEGNYDWLNVYVNGARVVHISGSSNWTNYTTKLNAGQNTIKFEYTKDGSAVQGSDAGYVDDLQFRMVASESYSSGAITGNAVTFNIQNPDDVYAVRITAKNGAQTAPEQQVNSLKGNNKLKVATDDVVALEQLANSDLSTQEKIDVVTVAIVNAITKIAELPEGQEKVDLGNRIIEIQSKLTSAQNVINATNGVANATNISNGNLTEQSAIDIAKQAVANAQALVTALPDGALKTSLQTQLDTATGKINLAQDVLNARNEVSKALSIANGDLTTQSAIDLAKQAVTDAQALVNKLPEGQIKTDLQTQLDVVKATIALAQDILNAKNAVRTVTVTSSVYLGNQAVIDTARQAISVAQPLVTKLPSSEIKTSFQTEIDVAIVKVDTAQAVLDVKTAEQSKNQSAVDKATESIIKVRDESIRIDLTKKLAVVQQYININKTLDGILNSNLNTYPSVTQAVYALNGVKPVLTAYPAGSDKNVLTSKYNQAFDKIGQSLISLLEQKEKGKKEDLDNVSLRFLVEYAIKQVGATSIKDRGAIHGFVMPLLHGKATGNEVNQVINSIFE